MLTIRIPRAFRRLSVVDSSSDPLAPRSRVATATLVTGRSVSRTTEHVAGVTVRVATPQGPYARLCQFSEADYIGEIAADGTDSGPDEEHKRNASTANVTTLPSTTLERRKSGPDACTPTHETAETAAEHSPRVRTVHPYAVRVFTSYTNRGESVNRMNHDPTSRTSFGCAKGLLEEFDEITDNEDVSRELKLRKPSGRRCKGDLDGSIRSLRRQTACGSVANASGAEYE